MVGMQNFRSALGGFNRNDVVNYIEYLNNQHKSQVAQLSTQLQNAQEALAKAQAQPRNDELLQKLETAEARCAQLEAQLAAAGTAPTPTDTELEAYRRAERVERQAQERAAQIYTKANAVLADATAKVNSAADGMKAVAAQMSTQLEAAQQQLDEATAAMYAIRPED